MSLRRTIARRSMHRNFALETHVELGTANPKSQTLTLAGATFSGARRRMSQQMSKSLPRAPKRPHLSDEAEFVAAVQAGLKQVKP